MAICAMCVWTGAAPIWNTGVGLACPASHTRRDGKPRAGLDPVDAVIAWREDGAIVLDANGLFNGFFGTGTETT